MLSLFTSMFYFGMPSLLEAQVTEMSLTVQPAPSITTTEGETISPSHSEVHQFEASSGGTFGFENPDGSSVTIIFFSGTTMVTLDFFIDAYEKSAIIADRPLPIGKDVVGSLIYDMRTFEGAAATATFAAPFAMIVHYAEAHITNLNEETLDVYFWDESQQAWTTFLASTLDTAQNTITILTDHLTLFATLAGLPETPETPETAGTTGGGGGGGGGGVPTPSQVKKIGDMNNDGTVDSLDFTILMMHWGQTTPNNSADLNNDTIVDIFDLNLLMVYWSV